MSNLTLSQPLFLCGMMGSGKSTIGQKLANKLQVHFTDIDKLIMEEAGQSIPEIFKTLGEEAFRKLERDVLIRSSQVAEGVVALGGGALQNQHITDHLKIQGWLVYLKCDVDTLVLRLRKKRNRPMIANLSEHQLRLRLNELMAERANYYEQAHFSVTCDHRPVNHILEELIQKLKIYEQKYTG